MQKKEIDARVLFVQEDYKTRVSERKSLEKNWLLNVNYYAGNQHCEVNPVGELTDVEEKFSWQENEVYNHIAPIVEARLSKFSNIQAAVTVTPASSDTADVEKAKFSTRLLKSIEEENNLKKSIREATFWAELTGTAFYKIVWSPTKGRCLSESEGLFEGDIDISVCPPYEIYPDSLSASDMDEVRSVIHAKAYPVEVVEELWGVRPEPEELTVLGMDGADRASGEHVCSNRKAIPQVKDGYVTVIERYSLPDGANPNGRLLIVAGEHLLYDGALPYHTETGGKVGLPFVRQAAISQPSCFFGTSIIERLIPVQKAYNAIKNRKHEFFSRMTAGVLIAEDGSVDMENLEEEGIPPGKILLYRQGSNIPVMKNLGGVPEEFGKEEDRLLSEFVSVSGVSDYLLSSGTKGENLSGAALKLIMQQDSNRLAIVSDNIRFAVKEIGKRILLLYKQFATAKRMKKMYGENGRFGIEYFCSGDIGCDDIVFDVEDESVNSLEIRRETVREIYEMGLLNGSDGTPDSATKLKMLDMMGFGNWENSKDDLELHRKKAMREERGCAENELRCESIDNHSVHIAEHTRFLLGEDCPLSDKEREKLIMHIEAHKRASSEE